jgi:hypothetical protein
VLLIAEVPFAGGGARKTQEGGPNHLHGEAIIHPLYQGDCIGEVKAEIEGLVVLDWTQIHFHGIKISLYLLCNCSTTKLLLYPLTVNVSATYQSLAITICRNEVCFVKIALSLHVRHMLTTTVNCK